jgi:hypothetical protein
MMGAVYSGRYPEIGPRLCHALSGSVLLNASAGQSERLRAGAHGMPPSDAQYFAHRSESTCGRRACAKRLRPDCRRTKSRMPNMRETPVNRALERTDCGFLIDAMAASRRSHQSRGPQASTHAKHHQRHIIVLGSACGERLCGGQDAPGGFQSSKPMTCFRELDHSLFTPLFVAGVHGFGNSVRKEHHQVGSFKRKDASLIAVW